MWGFDLIIFNPNLLFDSSIYLAKVFRKNDRSDKVKSTLETKVDIKKTKKLKEVTPDVYKT